MREFVEQRQGAGPPWWARWLVLQVSTVVGAGVAWAIGGGRSNPSSLGGLAQFLLLLGLVGSALWATALRRWLTTLAVALAHVGWIAVLARADARLIDPGVTALVWFPVGGVVSGLAAWSTAASRRTLWPRPPTVSRRASPEPDRGR